MHNALIVLICAINAIDSAGAEAVASATEHKDASLHETLKAVRAERDALREKLQLVQAELKACKQKYGSAPTTQLPSPSPPRSLSAEGAPVDDPARGAPASTSSASTGASSSTAAPSPPPRHHHPPHQPPPQPASPPPHTASPNAVVSTSAWGSDLAALEKSGSPCPVEWGSRRVDGTRLKSVGDTTLSGCCALCRGTATCSAFNFDANQGTGRCYLLAGVSAARAVKDASQRTVYSSAPKTDGCSCAKIGAYASGRDLQSLLYLRSWFGLGAGLQSQRE